MHACDRQTDRQTDRILIAIPRLHYMQRGKNRVLVSGNETAALHCNNSVMSAPSRSNNISKKDNTLIKDALFQFISKIGMQL